MCYTYNAEDVRIHNLCTLENITFTYNIKAKLINRIATIDFSKYLDMYRAFKGAMKRDDRGAFSNMQATYDEMRK